MQASKGTSLSHNRFLTGGLRTVAVASLMAALSVVFGKYLAFNATDFLRFSFENLPILLAGVLLGPVWGALVGAVADLVGCVLVGYAINPMVTLGAITIGLVGGAFWRIFAALPYGLRLAVSVLSAHLCGSVLIKTVGLWMLIYNEMPFFVVLLWRLLNYVIVGAMEFGLLYFLLKNRALNRLFRSLGSRAA